MYILIITRIIFLYFKIIYVGTTFIVNAALSRESSEWVSPYHRFIWPRPVEASFPLKSSAP